MIAGFILGFVGGIITILIIAVMMSNGRYDHKDDWR